MVCLALIATCYRFLPMRLNLLLGLGTLVLWLLPALQWGDAVETRLSAWVGLPLRYDVRPEWFVTSGFLGLALGFFYHQRPDLHRRVWPVLFGAGLCAYLAWLVWGAPFEVDRVQLYATEHAVIHELLGALGTWGFEVVLILGVLWPVRHGHNYRVPFFTWLGVNSLLIYALHKLLFVRVALPLLAEVERQSGDGGLRLTAVHLWAFVVVLAGAAYAVKRWLVPLLVAR
jgi:hypothetical protein